MLDLTRVQGNRGIDIKLILRALSRVYLLGKSSFWGLALWAVNALSGDKI